MVPVVLDLLPERPRQALSRFVSGPLSTDDIRVLRRYLLIEFKIMAWVLTRQGRYAASRYGFVTQACLPP